MRLARLSRPRLCHAVAALVPATDRLRRIPTRRSKERPTLLPARGVGTDDVWAVVDCWSRLAFPVGIDV